MLGAALSLPIALRVARSGDPNVSAATSSLTAAAFAFDADGVTTNAITLHTANAATDPLPGKVATVSLAAKAVSASLSTVVALPSEIPDDGTTPATIIVTLLNADGDPVVGVPVANISVTSTGTGNTITAVSAATDASGVASWTLVSTVAETKTITVTALGLELDTNPTVDVTGDAPGTWSFEPVGYVETASWDNEATIAPAGFTLDGSPNPTTGGFTERLGADIPWTPTFGGPAYIHKHIDAGEPGGFGSGRLSVALAGDGNDCFVGFETYYPVAFPSSDQSNKVAFWDLNTGTSGNQIGLGYLDGNAALPEDGKWCLTLESSFGADAQKLIGVVDVAYGSAQVHQFLFNVNTPGNGEILHVIDGVVNIYRDDITFPAEMTDFYYEQTNNGNRTTDSPVQRIIANKPNSPADADSYASIIYLSEPA